MTSIPTSVVIASRGRPALLRRCLVGLSQQFHQAFEVIVVADPGGLAALAELPFAANIKTVPFDEPNISTARNLGIAQAAGEVVAFIDDDAVPEPTWLHFLTGPFSREEVGAATGFVRGRNGISFQWKAETVDRTGTSRALPVPEDSISILPPRLDRAVKTPGTNMAVRRAVLADLGGFDPAFEFYLDEADLNLRIAEAGFHTAVVPMAQVHHAFAASPRRSVDRVPRDLAQIGASQAVFLRKHAATAQRQITRRSAALEQRRRLLRHMQSGTLDLLGVGPLMRGYEAGWDAGEARPLAPPGRIGRAAAAFALFAVPSEPVSVLIPARRFELAQARAEAAARISDGAVATVLHLSRSALYHRVWFDDAGYWIQRGGIWGRSARHQPIVRIQSFQTRVRAECGRVAPVRGLDCDRLEA